MITTEQLQQFCDTENSRYWLIAPWRHDGRIYATDGRILVSIPDDGRELPTPEADKKIVKADGILRTDSDYGHKWPRLKGRCLAFCGSRSDSGEVLYQQKIDGRWFDGRLCKLVLSLGNVKYAHDEEDSIQFRVESEDLYGAMAMILVDKRTEAAPCTHATDNG